MSDEFCGEEEEMSYIHLSIKSKSFSPRNLCNNCFELNRTWQEDWSIGPSSSTVILQYKKAYKCTDLPFRGDLSCHVSVVKGQGLIHEQTLVLTENHKTKRKILPNLHFFRDNNFTVVSSYILSNTLIFSLASLWISSSSSTSSLSFCA